MVNELPATTWWIRQGITRAVTDYGRTIRLPVHVVESLNRLNRERRALASELNEPTIAELSARMQMPAEKVQFPLNARRTPASPDQREKDVLRPRYDLGNGRVHTLDEIGGAPVLYTGTSAAALLLGDDRDTAASFEHRVLDLIHPFQSLPRETRHSACWNARSSSTSRVFTFLPSATEQWPSNSRARFARLQRRRTCVMKHC